MKIKILALLAVGLLAGPISANAIVIYEYTELGDTDFSFSYPSPNYISGDIRLDDYACLTSTCDIDFFLTGP